MTQEWKDRIGLAMFFAFLIVMVLAAFSRSCEEKWKPTLKNMEEVDKIQNPTPTPYPSPRNP